MPWWGANYDFKSKVNTNPNSVSLGPRRVLFHPFHIDKVLEIHLFPLLFCLDMMISMETNTLSNRMVQRCLFEVFWQLCAWTQNTCRCVAIVVTIKVLIMLMILPPICRIPDVFFIGTRKHFVPIESEKFRPVCIVNNVQITLVRGHLFSTSLKGVCIA